MISSIPTVRLTSAPRDAVQDLKGDFSLVIVYEDQITRAPAGKVCEPLIQQFGGEFDFQCSWWKYDFLKHPHLMEEAVDAAAHADVIILAAYADQELPMEVQHWIRSWEQRRLHQFSAVVALIGRPKGSPEAVTPVETYLESVARAARMDFFAKHFTYASEDRMKQSAPSSPLPSPWGSLPDFEDPPDAQSWGINE